MTQNQRYKCSKAFYIIAGVLLILPALGGVVGALAIGLSLIFIVITCLIAIGILSVPLILIGLILSELD